MIHALKTEQVFFEASAADVKSFEARKNDRPYHTGDYVALNEWSGEGHTGRCTLHKIVYILSDPAYCKEGYVVLGLEPCANIYFIGIENKNKDNAADRICKDVKRINRRTKNIRNLF